MPVQRAAAASKPTHKHMKNTPTDPSPTDALIEHYLALRLPLPNAVRAAHADAPWLEGVEIPEQAEEHLTV